MTSIKLFTLAATICVATARTILDDPGPHIYAHSKPLPPLDLNQGEVVMKEAVLYLTPSQIKAFEASQGNTNQDQRNQFTEEEILNVEAEIKRQLERQNIYSIPQSSNEKPIANAPRLPPPVVEEPVTDNPENYPLPYHQKWIPIPKQEEQQHYFSPPQGNPQHQIAESYSYVKFFTDQKVHETPKLQLFHPIPHEHKVDPELEKFLEVQKDPVHHKEYKLVPYEYKTLEVPRLEDVKEITKIASFLEKYNEPNTAANHEVFEAPKEQEVRNQFQSESELKYAPQFDDQKNSDDAQNFLIKLEKERALARAEAILKAPPTVIRKEVSIKRRPITPTKHSNAPAPSWHGKQWFHRYIPLEHKKEVSEIPAHKPEKITSHRHVWKH